MSFVRDDSLRILIGDHDPLIRHTLQSRLKRQGHIVLVAENGQETLYLFESTQQDLVILDVLLPKLDGFKVLSRIRSGSSIPVILLTSLNQVADRVTGLHLGADDYVCKPFSARELDARIRAVMRRATRPSSTHTSHA